MQPAEQEAYKEWFWSNLNEEGLEENKNFFDSTEMEFSIHKSKSDKETIELNSHLAQLKDVVTQTRLSEQEKYYEIIRGAASLYLLQGDLHGAKVCEHLERLMSAAALSQDLPQSA